MKTGRPPCPSAFSLIELLVAIGVMAVLITLLLPVVSSMRSRANEAACVSNVRNIVAAILRHSSENGGRLISAWETPYTEESYWANKLGVYMGNSAPKQRVGRDYLQCPTQHAIKVSKGEAAPFGTYGVVYTGGPGSAARRLFGMRKDSGHLVGFRPNTMLVGDAGGLIYSPSVWRLDSEDGASSSKHAAPYNQALFPHRDRMMAGFVDGSVRPVSLDEWKDGAGELKLQ